MVVSRREMIASLLAVVPSVLLPVPGRAREPLTAAEGERLGKLIPRTYAKLQRREPLYVAVFGDDVSTFHQPSPVEGSYDAALAWHGRFLDRLGGDFHYHGGVTDLDPVSAVKRADADIVRQWQEYRALVVAREKSGKGPEPALPGAIGAQKEAPQAVFSVNDLLRRGLPPSRRPVSASAIFVRNYSRDGAVAVQAMEPLTSEVFLSEAGAETDLVLLSCGGRDALAGASLASFREAMERAVAYCREKGADVVLAAVPPSLEGGDPRVTLGRARPYAAVLREIAETAGVFFADLGNALVRRPSDLINLNARDAFAAALDVLRPHFDHPGIEPAGVSWHPNGAAHRRMGDTVADWLVRGEPVPQLEVSAFLDLTAGPVGEAVLTLRLFNAGKVPVSAVVSPLVMTGHRVKEGAADAAVVVGPGKAKRLAVPVVRVDGGRPPGDEARVRGSVLLSDDGFLQFADFAAPVQPVSVLWPEEREDGVEGDCLVKAQVVNTGTVTIDAVAKVFWRGQETVVAVKAEPGATVPLPLRLALPDPGESFRFREDVRVEIPVGDRLLGWVRTIEGVRHAGLNQRLPLAPLGPESAKAAGEGAAGFGSVSVQADLEGIYFIVEVPPEIVSDEVEGKPWGALEIQIDGRGEVANGTFGCIGKIAMDIPRADGPVKVKSVPPAVFGEGYAYQYHPDSFRAKAETRPDGARRIEFTMKRGNLVHHEWSLDGAGQSDFGINVRLFLCDVRGGGPSVLRAGVLAESGFPVYDGRGLTLFELRANPAKRWSVRIF